MYIYLHTNISIYHKYTIHFFINVSPRVLEGLMAWLLVVTGALVSMLLEKVRVTVMNLVLV